MKWTEEELAELRRFDEEVDASVGLSREERRASDLLDMTAKLEGLDNRQRKIAAQQKAYREENREKIAAQQKAYYEENREKYRAYMREYMRKRRQKEKSLAGVGAPVREKDGGTPPMKKNTPSV